MAIEILYQFIHAGPGLTQGQGVFVVGPVHRAAYDVDLKAPAMLFVGLKRCANLATISLLSYSQRLALVGGHRSACARSGLAGLLFHGAAVVGDEHVHSGLGHPSGAAHRHWLSELPSAYPLPHRVLGLAQHLRQVVVGVQAGGGLGLVGFIQGIYHSRQRLGQGRCGFF